MLKGPAEHTCAHVFKGFAPSSLRRDLLKLAVDGKYGIDELDDEANRSQAGEDAKPFPACLILTKTWKEHKPICTLIDLMREKLTEVGEEGGQAGWGKIPTFT